MVYTPKYTSATKVYNRSGLSATEIDLSSNLEPIEDGETELEAYAGRSFADAQAFTVYLNGTERDIFGNKATTLLIPYYPILSITEFKFLNTDGSVGTTLDTLSSVEISEGTYYSDDYWMATAKDPLTNGIVCTGFVNFMAETVPVGFNRVKIVGTYGYGSVPAVVETCATCMVGIRAWVQFLGGQYNRLNSYSIPQQSVNKGDFYQRGKQMIEELTQEAMRLLKIIGRTQDTLAFGTGGSNKR